MENIEIDYKYAECTDLVAFVLKGWNEQGKMWSYNSPFVYENTEDAYHASCVKISGK